MGDLRKDAGGRRADLARRAVGANKLRETRLDLLVAPLQRIVVRIRNLRRILAVIERVMIAQAPLASRSSSAAASSSVRSSTATDSVDMLRNSMISESF